MKKGKKNPQRANSSILSRTLLLMVVCGIVAFIPLIITLYQIQIRDHETYQNLAISQQTSELTVNASRGTIYDRTGSALAISGDVETVFISPKQIYEDEQDVELIASELSRILEVDYDGILEKAADTSSMYKTIRLKVEKEMADEVRASIEANKFTGIYLVDDTKRYYPYNTLAAHVIGYVGTDNYGLDGVELLYEKELSGTDGYIITAVNGRGTELLSGYEEYYDAEMGNNVTLTIDTTIQYYLEKHIEQAMEDYDIQNGAAGIIMKVDTGEILAMASFGGYDLNHFNEVYDEEVLQQLQQYTGEEYEEKYSEALFAQWRNKAVSDTYEPGSVFKIITLATALEEGVIDDNSVFYCAGSMDVKGRTDPVHCWREWGHGSQTLAEAVQNSCNMAFVQIGLKIGADTFWEYIEAFGFFEPTGVDLTGESDSIWWDKSVFADPDNYSSLAVTSFGQTFNITPIQLITAVSAVANGGYLMKPYVVSQVTDSAGNVVMSNEPTVVRQVISEETSQRVCQILESVVSVGTGKGAQVTGYKIGGKTGTSEKIGQQEESERIVSFMGIAPADDPEIAVLVLLDTPGPENETYVSGGQMAAPTVGKILADVLPYIGIEPTYTEEELLTIDVSVPRVTDMTLDEAAELLADRNLGYRVVGSGSTVTDQVPAASSTVPGSAEVILYMGVEKPTDPVVVPDVTGLSESEARQRLEAANLYMKATGASGGTSSMQSIAWGTSVEMGTVVEVTFIDTTVYD